MVSKAMFYLFVMGILLLLLGYSAGAIGLGQTIFTGVNQLDLTATGRDASGQFAGYAR